MDDRRLNVLSLSPKAKRILFRMGFRTVQDILDTPDMVLLKICGGFGLRVTEEVLKMKERLQSEVNDYDRSGSEDS